MTQEEIDKSLRELKDNLNKAKELRVAALTQIRKYAKVFEQIANCVKMMELDYAVEKKQTLIKDILPSTEEMNDLLSDFYSSGKEMRFGPRYA